MLLIFYTQLVGFFLVFIQRWYISTFASTYNLPLSSSLFRGERDCDLIKTRVLFLMFALPKWPQN